ncbi:hypothetical protein ACIQTZ_12425 [Paenarthrobacter sp. NPDC090520]|uniref:hypothetical protein n=1 Tax=Paenarthrobacter sp. NPDC090520 TaxID=3364382 RepID=UPI00380807B2
MKSAAEAWTLAVADGFRRKLPGDGTIETKQRAAALIFIVKALVDDRMSAAQPGRKFPGFTDVSVLAEAVELIFAVEADKLNGLRLPLKAGQPLVALS